MSKSSERFQLLRIISSELGRKCARDSSFKVMWNSWTHTRRSATVKKLLDGARLLDAIKGVE